MKWAWKWPVITVGLGIAAQLLERPLHLHRMFKADWGPLQYIYRYFFWDANRIFTTAVVVWLIGLAVENVTRKRKTVASEIRDEYEKARGKKT